MADDKKPVPPVAPVAAKAAPVKPPVEPDAPPSRGAQVQLDGPALSAARGGVSPDMQGNVDVKKELEASGEVADGTTPDGSTRSGKPAPDTTGEPYKPAPSTKA